jgi:hypothetical protein
MELETELETELALELEIDAIATPHSAVTIANASAKRRMLEL